MIHVAAGVVVHSDNKILVAQRHAHADHGGLWEFPGGKIEKGEDAYTALCRELKEEVNIDVVEASPLMKIEHDYECYSVVLDIWTVNKFYGEAKGVEGQLVRWVDRSELQTLRMPEANQAILSRLYNTAS